MDKLNVFNSNSRAVQPLGDFFGAAAGYGVLGLLGMKFPVCKLPSLKTLFIGTLATGVGGLLGREALNLYAGKTNDQNQNPMRLGAIGVFGVGMVVLSQVGRLRNLPYVGRFVSLMPELANAKQILAFSLVPAAIMVAARYFLGSTITPVTFNPQKHGGAASIDVFTLEQMSAIPTRLNNREFVFTKDQQQAWNARVDALRQEDRAAEKLPKFAREFPLAEGLPGGSKPFALAPEHNSLPTKEDATVQAIHKMGAEALRQLFEGHGAESEGYALTEKQGFAYNDRAKELNAANQNKENLLPLFIRLPLKKD